jgi:hypothetical protein
MYSRNTLVTETKNDLILDFGYDEKSHFMSESNNDDIHNIDNLHDLDPIKRSKWTHYIIGESDTEELETAVKIELTHGLCPLVSKMKNARNNYRNNVMESYAGHLALACVETTTKHHGIIEFTNEGCKSDMTYHEGKPEECMMIQIKTTSRMKQYQRTENLLYGIWSFQMKEYPGHLMMLRSLEDGRCWLIQYDLLREKYNSDSITIYNLPDALEFWDKFAVANSDGQKSLSLSQSRSSLFPQKSNFQYSKNDSLLEY